MTSLGSPALVVTIATGGIAAALGDAIGRGSSIEISATGFVGQIVTAQFGFVPLIAVIAVAIYAAACYAQDRLLWGHYIYALAQNRRAVIEAGVPAKRLLGLVFTGSSLSSGVAGILLAADLSSGQPSIASSMFLDGLTAVLVRGGALLGLADSKFQIIKGGLLLLGVTVVIWARGSFRAALGYLHAPLSAASTKLGSTAAAIFAVEGTAITRPLANR